MGKTNSNKTIFILFLPLCLDNYDNPIVVISIF